MNLSASTPAPGDASALIAVMNSNTSSDALHLGFSAAQWAILVPYMMASHVAQGQVLIQPGAHSRECYWVESGSLSVHAQDSKGRIRLSMVGPGSVVGEGGFFSQQERVATVQAAGASRVWTLGRARFVELSNRQPAIAAMVVLEMAGLLAKRIRSRTRRFSIT